MQFRSREDALGQGATSTLPNQLSVRKQLAQGVRKPRGPRAEPEPELDSDSAPRFFNRVTGGLDSIWYTATDNALMAEARAKGLDRVRISDANIDGRVLRLYAPSLFLVANEC